MLTTIKVVIALESFVIFYKIETYVIDIYHSIHSTNLHSSNNYCHSALYKIDIIYCTKEVIHQIIRGIIMYRWKYFCGMPFNGKY